MNPEEPKRGVKLSVTSRSPGSAPDLGPVDQMSRIGRVREGVRRRADGNSSRRRSDQSKVRRHRMQRKVVAMWSAVIGLVAFGALAAAFGLWLWSASKRAPDKSERVRSEDSSRAQKRSKFNSPSDRETLALVKRALAVRDPDEVAELIRPGSLSPAEVVTRLRDLERQEGKAVDLRWLSSVDKNGLSLEGVEVTCGGGANRRKRLALLTPDAAGVWKLDFPAYARLVEPSWDKLLAGDEPSAVVRVSVAQDRYFNGPFQNEREWAAYGMVSPDMEELLVGYCKRSSEQFQALERMWSTDDASVLRTTLEIRRVEGADRRQFQITRVLAEDWVMGDQPFDEAVAVGELSVSEPPAPPPARPR